MAGSKLYLYIPTRGRINVQDTLKSLPPQWRSQRTTLVCPVNEVNDHRKNFPDLWRITVQPDPDMTIAAKRAWIFRKAAKLGHEKIMMLDDDLRFGVRHHMLPEFKGFGHDRKKTLWNKVRKERPGVHSLYLTEPSDPKLNNMFKRLEWMLDHYRHGGISPRFMNQEFGCEFIMNARVHYSLAYHVPTVLKHCKLGRIESREDFDYTLQLLRAGFENAVYAWGISEQYKGFNAPGGAHDERSMKRSNADAMKLARLHRGLVKVTTKEYLVSTPRMEVIVYWQRAIEEGKNPFI